MPLYLSRFSYTAETWSRLINHPEDRAKAAQSCIESIDETLDALRRAEQISYRAPGTERRASERAIRVSLNRLFPQQASGLLRHDGSSTIVDNSRPVN